MASADLNAFSVISTGDSKNTDALIRILREGSNAPSLLVIVDGDEGGSKRLEALKPFLEAHTVKSFQLQGGTTIEDHLGPPRGEHTLTLSLAMSPALSRLLAKADQLGMRLRNDFAKPPRARATPETR